MNFAERNRIFVEKLRNLPDKKKKIILWAIIVVLGIVMGFFWMRGAVGNFYKITELTKSINFPSIDVSTLPDMPSLDILSPSGGSPEGRQTADWKTYINIQYGFEIKIPEDWVVKENSEGLTFTTDDLLKKKEQNSLNCEQGKECDPGELPYAIGFFKFIAEGGDKYNADELINGSSIVDLNQIKWNRYELGGMLSDIHFRTTNDKDQGYDFGVYMDIDENTIKTVLSTFKFLNK